MGALHEGHLSLIRAAAHECDEVVISIFVNPTQFGPSEDFDRYPRPIERDVELAEASGATVAFLPTVEEIYPRNSTVVKVLGVTEPFEGATRPGHFDGVATIVLKLFNIVQPTLAYFGLKDLQQCAVIRRMVEDLNVPIILRFIETLREPDGLAMSSRNQYLTSAERANAPWIYRTLVQLAEELGDLSVDPNAPLDRGVTKLKEQGFIVDYLSLINPSTMEVATGSQREVALIVAAKIGKTRLIDNLRFTRS
jgi:pantoate--beta-alanine ligase